MMYNIIFSILITTPSSAQNLFIECNDLSLLLNVIYLQPAVFYPTMKMITSLLATFFLLFYQYQIQTIYTYGVYPYSKTVLIKKLYVGIEFNETSVTNYIMLIRSLRFFTFCFLIPVYYV